MNEQIQKLMKTLNISEDEARQVIEDDRRIDKGEKLFELSAELEAGAKKARQADRKKSDTPIKRERKSDNDKAMLIAVIVAALRNANAEINVTNAEREIELRYNDRKFKIVLSAPRSWGADNFCAFCLLTFGPVAHMRSDRNFL